MSTILVNNITPYSGGTINLNGVTVNNGVLSATTYVNIPSSFFTGGTVDGNTNFTSSITANTISTNSLSGTTIYGDGYNITNLNVDFLPTITKSELDTFISTSGLTKGQHYKITGVNPELYGGTDIILQAVSTNAISKNGHGLFYNPKYNEYDIWSPISLIEFESQIGNFSTDEYIIGDSGQIGKMIGLPGEIRISFIAIQGEFSGGTTFTGVNSSAYATVVNLTSANYNIGDRVIWGGKLWANVSGTSVNVVNQVIATGTSGYWQYFYFGSGVEYSNFTITNGVETFASNGNTGCWNLTGDHGGYGCLFDTGYGYVHFNAGPVDGIPLTGSYTTNVVSNINTGDYTPWALGSSWELVPYNETDYIPTWDIIEYEYEHNNISLRKDVYNEVISEWDITVNGWGYNSIKSMQWGGNVFILTANNAYLYNLVNFNGENIYNVNLDKNSGFDSYQYWGFSTDISTINIGIYGYLYFNSIGNYNRINNINIGAKSYIENITLSNNDYDNIYFNGINLGNSGDNSQVYIQDVNLSSGSYFYGLELGNSNVNDTYIQNINLYNGSGIFNIKLDQGSYMYGIHCYNYGRLRDIQIGQGAYIEYIDVYNGGDMFSIKLEGGANYGGWSKECYVYGIIIGQDSYMHDVVVGLGSYIEDIDMGESYCRFKHITLGESSKIYNITYHSNNGQFRYNKIGNNTKIHNIDLYNCYFDYNTIGDNSEIQYMGLGNNARFDYNEIGNSCNFGSITISNNAELGFFKVGLDSFIDSITLKEGVYLGDITIGEYLSLTNATFDTDVYGKIIDRNNNDFPATYYVDGSSNIYLADIYYAGVITLKTQKATLTYTGYTGTGFTIYDLIIDATTNAQGNIANNDIYVGTVTSEVIATADGNTRVFPFTLANQRIVASTVTLTDTVETFTDNGNGILSGSYGGTGTTNYHTGVGTVTFNSNPAYGQAITVNYQYATGGTLTLNMKSPKTLSFNNGDTINNGNGGSAIVAAYTATTTAATISRVFNYPNNDNSNDINNGIYPIKFIPEYGLTVTFSGSPISTIDNNQIAMPATSFVANGSNDDYIVITRKNNTVTEKVYVQQIDAQNYN